MAIIPTIKCSHLREAFHFYTNVLDFEYAGGDDPQSDNGFLVLAREGGPGTGLGWVRKSFLLGLDDPRGQAHLRLYRASFLWGRADLIASDLEPLGPATEAEWRAAVERGDQ